MQYSALIHSRGHRASLIELINQKEVVGDLFNQLRLALQRRTQGRPAQVSFGSLILCCSYEDIRSIFVFSLEISLKT